MALLQSDYDALAPQLLIGKRTAGTYANKTIRDYDVSRGIYGTMTPAIHIFYTTGEHEVLKFEPYVDLFVPGSVPGKTSATTP